MDGNGEIDIFEMEKMFVSLCSIVESSENDQLKRNRKEHEKAMLEEKIRKEKEELALILERERELENMKYKVNVLSENFKLKMEKTRNKSSIQRHAPKKKHQKRFSALEENRQKVESCRAMAGQLADPTRDYRKFDSRRRAQVSMMMMMLMMMMMMMLRSCLLRWTRTTAAASPRRNTSTAAKLMTPSSRS